MKSYQNIVTFPEAGIGKQLRLIFELEPRWTSPWISKLTSASGINTQPIKLTL